MIDELSLLIEKHWSIYGLTEPYERYQISFTKFCQRVVGRHTKVLFFVTFAGRPLCIIKTVRFPEHNEALLREAKHQSEAPQTRVLSAPRVYWTGEIAGRAVYAEEYIDTLPVSLSDYRALHPHIVEFASELSHSGTITATALATKLEPYLPNDPVIQKHLRVLQESAATFELGLTHGDMGRQNILGTKERAWVIDWERAGDIPIRYFDVTDYGAKLMKSGVRITGDPALDDALFSVRSVYTALYRRFPNAYLDLVHSPI